VSVLRMIQGLIVSRAVYVAAKLGIADLLEESSRPADELARLTDSHPSSLYRILRLLPALGIFTEPEPGSSAFPRWESGCEPEFRGRYATERCSPTGWAVCALLTTS
jgi:Dimerisation domain